MKDSELGAKCVFVEDYEINVGRHLVQGVDVWLNNPHLQGVYGRTTGAVAAFPYSDTLVKAHVVWDDESLDRWLADTEAFLPGNNMDFLVPKPQERSDVISYLKQASGK